jgi:hypothetical protein
MPNREQAERVDFSRASSEGIKPWKRAVTADVDLLEGNAADAFRVKLDDGDRHEVLLAGVEGEMYGACDCEGWSFHRHEWKSGARPCAHLSAVRQAHALADTTIPETFTGSTMEPEEMDVDVVKPGEESSEPTDDVVEDVPQPTVSATTPARVGDTFQVVLEDVPEDHLGRVLTLADDLGAAVVETSTKRTILGFDHDRPEARTDGGSR